MINKNNTQDRGQVGIGTLIVFIALVLVAAIAAGVLINTAGFLQSQAEATGQESTDQVSNNLNVFSVVGADDAGGDDLNKIRLTVGIAPGSDGVDLADVEIQWVNGDSHILTEGGSPGFSINNIVGTSNVLSNPEDRAELVIDTENGASSVDAVSAGQTVDLTITTADGAQTTVVLNGPNPLESPTEL